MAKAIDWAVTHGAKVLNMSRDWHHRTREVRDAVLAAHAAGMVIVGAADNYNKPVSYSHFGDISEADAREFCSKVIVVAATDRSDVKWEISPGARQNVYGNGSNWGEFVDVSAPGVEIVSTCIDSTCLPDAGTSYAAPHVSGVAALLLSQGKTQQEVYALISSTADPLVFPNKPWNGLMGAGRLNAYSALRGARDGQAPGGPTDTRLLRDPDDVRVTWRAATDNDAIGEYVVYRRGALGDPRAETLTLLGAEYCRLGRVFWDGTDDSDAFTSTLAGGVYTFHGGLPAAGEDHHYALVAYDKTGNAGPPVGVEGYVELHSDADGRLHADAVRFAPAGN